MNARDLFARYVQQQTALGSHEVVFDEAPTMPQARAAEPGEGGPPPPPPPPPEAVTPRRTRAPKAGGGATSPPSIPGRGIEVAAPGTDLFSDNPVAGASLDDIARMVSSCTLCPLHEGRTNGVPGEGPADARLVVVGEGPGKNEDEQGRPFVGRAGKLLDDILAAIDCPRETVYIANIVKCRPPSNRKPQTDECLACVPYLHRQLEIIAPRVILAMGGTAAETLLNTRASLSSLRNKVHEYRGIPLIVTYHPAALLRNPHWKRPTWDDVRIARQLLER